MEKPKLEHDGIHVRIEEPISKRKEILESAIFATELLQKYENFKKIRNLKQKQMALLKVRLKELSLLINELKLKELPQIKAEKPVAEAKEKEIIKKPKEMPKETSKLSEELERIKAKLQKLQI